MQTAPTTTLAERSLSAEGRPSGGAGRSPEVVRAEPQARSGIAKRHATLPQPSAGALLAASVFMPAPSQIPTRAPAPDEVVPRALAFLESHRCMTLATTGSEGLWAATVFYVNDGFQLYFLSFSDTRHVRNLMEAGRVAATIGDDTGLWERIGGVQLEGTADIAAEAERPAVLRAFAQRYTFPDTLWWSSEPHPSSREQRVYVVRPTRLFFVDHGFAEARLEVPVDRLTARAAS
jgi:uncharacterized protein YhbP (UPF0306 family)